MTQGPNGIRHGRWGDKKIIRFAMQPLAGTWQIHHAVNHHVGHMNSFRPQLPGKGLRQVALGRLEGDIYVHATHCSSKSSRYFDYVGNTARVGFRKKQS
jgi:hypothetical protein